MRNAKSDCPVICILLMFVQCPLELNEWCFSAAQMPINENRFWFLFVVRRNAHFEQQLWLRKWSPPTHRFCRACEYILLEYLLHNLHIQVGHFIICLYFSFSLTPSLHGTEFSIFRFLTLQLWFPTFHLALSSQIPHRSCSHLVHTSIKAIQMKCVSYRNRNEASSSISPFVQTASLMIQQVLFANIDVVLADDARSKRAFVTSFHTLIPHTYIYTIIVVLAFIHLSHSIELSNR